jgi:diguanylate cyclase (GGDEF)-like protein/PAS domain S-box-containing protein
MYIAAMLLGVLVSVGVVTIISRENDARRVRTGDLVRREIATISSYQDARIAVLNESASAAGYYIYRDDIYIAGFDAARDSADEAFAAIDAMIAPGDATAHAQLADLQSTHASIAAGFQEVLDGLRARNDADTANLVASTNIADVTRAYLQRLSTITLAEQSRLLDAEQQDRAAQRRAEEASIIIIGVWTLLMVAGVLAAYRWVIRPIRQIGNAARAIAAGDVAMRAPERGAYELEHLGVDVNRMADALIRRSAEINGYLSKNLESRTAELERSHVALEKSERRFRSLVQNASDIVTVVDAQGTLCYVSPSVERVLGLGPERYEGENLMTLVHPEDAARVDDLFRQSLAHAGNHPAIEFRIRHADGTWHYLEATPTNLLDDPVVRGVVHNSRDITDRKRFESRLVDMATTDGLTGLRNGRSLRDELNAAIERALAANARGAVVFVDLDQFKDVNDTLGHAAGDGLLVELADLLRSELRDDDVIGRLGGDEFGIVMPDIEPHEARLAATRLLAAIRHRLFRAGDQNLSVTASIGIAIFPDQGYSVDELLAGADLAMYRSKRNGRNRVSTFSPGMASPAGDRLSWQQRLRDAIDRDRLLFYAQPIVDLHRGEVRQFELLLRLKTEGGTVMLPGAFLSGTESTGLLHEVDRWVARQAIRVIAASRDRGEHLCVAANLSAKAFSDPELLAMIRTELETSGIDGSCLTFEVTEDAGITEIDQAHAFVEELRSLGCRFALDDFGVGFSSLSRLKQLPVDSVKIDGSFVRDLPRSAVDQAFVRAIVALAASLGKTTVAEFVEDAETLELIRSYGVDYAQGFYLGKPAALTEFLTVSQAA